MIYTQKQIDRFWSNVDMGEPSECWPWQRSRHSAGYGQVGLNGLILKAHKVAWEIRNNERIPVGVSALHNCGNRLCCNPAHVYLQGKVAPLPEAATVRRTAAQGEANSHARLTARQAVLIKYRLAELTTREVAETIGISYNAVWDIRNGVTWRHI